MAKIFRGNLLAVRRQIAEELAALEAGKLDAADQFSTVAVSGSSSPALAAIKHESTFYNTSFSAITITLPNSGLSSHIGKRFHFTASATYSATITITSVTAGLLRDKANASGPFTVTNGTLTVTVTAGLSGTTYYSVGGDFA